MLSRIVTAKLKENRRLVIPELGVFLVREDGGILFSELMRGDDGVLRSAVAADRGVAEYEAEQIIARFVSEVRGTLDCGLSYRLERLGVLSRDERGLIVFRSLAEEHRTETPAPRSSIGRILAESSPKSPSAVPASGDAARPAAETQPARPAPRRKRKGGTDIFLIVAIVIAVAAIAVMAYGFWTASQREETSIVEMFVPSAGQKKSSGDDAAPAAGEAADEIDLSIPSSGI